MAMSRVIKAAMSGNDRFMCAFSGLFTPSPKKEKA